MRKKYKVNIDKMKECIFTITSDGKLSSKSQQPNINTTNEDNEEVKADFETAIAATGFGKFNVFLLLLTILSMFSSVFATTTMSYVLPIAQCDLSLTLEDKGVLNAITYAGMISSACIWGYLADTIGRKKIITCGFLLDGFVVIVGGFSQQYISLLISRFLSGLILNGPYAAFTVYINEFHSAKYRIIIPVIAGVGHCIGNMILPLLGWLIFSDTINISLFGGLIILRSWNVFILISSLPSLIAGFIYLFLPESPKFLMTIGKNEEALRVFQKTYSYNKGKSSTAYPIKHLLDETKLHESGSNTYENNITVNRTKMQALKEEWRQLTSLFFPPYISKIILVFFIQFLSMIGLNSFRLWLPQFFTMINDYRTLYPEKENANLCAMLKISNSTETVNGSSCFVNYDNDPVYINNIITTSIMMIIFFVVMATIRKIRKKFVVIGSGLITGMSGISMYFAQTEMTAVVLFSVFHGFSGISSHMIMSIVVDIFPTTLRTMSISLTMMLGRLGSTIGNLLFPILLNSGCLSLFITIGCLGFGAAFFTIFLPKTDMKALD